MRNGRWFDGGYTDGPPRWPPVKPPGYGGGDQGEAQSSAVLAPTSSDPFCMISSGSTLPRFVVPGPPKVRVAIAPIDFADAPKIRRRQLRRSGAMEIDAGSVAGSHLYVRHELLNLGGTPNREALENLRYRVGR
jgi:hypothetical protein